MNDKTIETSCACGAVQIKISGEPRTTMLCACKDCQTASGSGHTALALYSDEITQISGETNSFSVVADSGAAVNRHFCPACGTPIFGVTARVPGHKLIPAGLLGEAASDYSPKSMIFAQSRMNWDFVDPKLPQHAKYKEK